MRVTFFTTWKIDCGNAGYSADLVHELLKVVEIDLVPVTPRQTDPVYFQELGEAMNRGELAHIQHEYSFFNGIAPGEARYADFLRNIKVPRVVTLHSILGHHWQLYKGGRREGVEADLNNMDRLTFNDPAQLIVHTNMHREVLLKCGVPGEKINVIPPGIPAPPFYVTDVGQSKSFLNIPPHQQVMTVFGFVTEIKGYDLVLDILPRLPAHVVLLVAGGARFPNEQEYLNRLQARLNSMGLQNRVIITGFLPDHVIPTVMAASDLILVPQTYAVSSYSVHLAIAYGKPIITSDLPPFRELNDRGAGIVLFKSGDSNDLYDKVSNLIWNEPLKSVLSKDNSTYSQEYSWYQIARHTEKVYRKVLG